MKRQRTKLVIITGLAGSGKTVAVRALEDSGFYCVDNLPASLIPHFLSGIKSGEIPQRYVALALDSRDPATPMTFEKYYEELEKICDVEVLFLDANETAVLKRFRETRRLHPLSGTYGEKGGRTLQDAIHLDAEVLFPMRQLAARVVETSEMTPSYLRNLIMHLFSADDAVNHILVNIISFGFKHGTLQDVDLVFDVRCFSNPHYVEELRPLTGLNDKVRDYVFADKNVSGFVDRVVGLLQFLYPLYQQEGKRYLGIGIGCTGGKHRSVAIAEEIRRRLLPDVPKITVEHRHFDKE